MGLRSVKIRRATLRKIPGYRNVESPPPLFRQSEGRYKGGLISVGARGCVRDVCGRLTNTEDPSREPAESDK